MTGHDYIANAMRACGALSSGDEITGTEITDAEVLMNRMLDGYQAERLMIFQILRQVLVPTVLKGAYTLGPNGDFNQARPAKIERYSILNLGNPAQPLELALDPILTEYEWQNTPVKNITGALPLIVWDDKGFPLRTLNYWPVPNVQVNFVIYPWAALTEVTDFVTDIEFPPAYQELIHYDMASRICVEWPGDMSRLPFLTAFADKARAKVKGMNMQPMVMSADPALLGSGDGGPQYNWLYDGPVGRT